MIGRGMIGAALAALMLGLWTPVQAACDVGGRDQPCATQNGHYRIRLPEGPGPHPTVVYLYGSTGNSGEILANDGFVQAFVARGYAVIVPAALDIRYADGLDSGWHLRNERGRKQRNDAAFVAEVLRDAELRHRIDRRRVLMAGMSRGGFLAWEIACHNPRLATAYAPVAAGYLGEMPGRCAEPVRILHTHGRGDRIVPLNPDARWSSGGARMAPLGEALAIMARTSGCSAPASPQRFREYERTDWPYCQTGGSVSLLVHKGAHTIPLSWFSTVIDWFEGDARAPAQGATGGGTPRFQGVGARDRGASGGRFKRAPVQ